MKRTESITGSRIRVQNRDGSSHVEEVVEAIPGPRVFLQLKEFAPPLDRLAERFVEEWTFTVLQQGTRDSHKFSPYPRHEAARLVL